MKNNLKLSDELISDFNDFWEFKQELVQKCRKSTDSLSNSNQINNTLNSSDNFSIKLNNNFLSIRKYKLPWDMLFLSDKFYNVGMITNKLNEITTENLKKPPMYCVFTYTPFESSISSFWITNLHAYILSRVLNQEFQSISEIIIKVQTLLSNNQENSYHIIK